MSPESPDPISLSRAADRPPPPPRKRRRWALSVRAMLLAVLVVGVALGWIVRAARVQRDAVAAIEKEGGVVCYDWQPMRALSVSGFPITTPSITPIKERPGPRWLVDRIGMDYFATADKVLIPFNGKPDRAMLAVGRLGRLRELTLCFGPNNDVGLAQISGLTDLRKLDLQIFETQDRDLIHLRGLVRLEELSIMDGTGVTDAGLASLAGLTRLRSLSLHHASVEGAGLAHLAAMDHLDSLSLSRSRIRDLAMLGRRKALKTLDLSDTEVTDESLHVLGGFPNLASLSLESTHITANGIARLREALPRTEIHYSRRP